MGSIGDLKKNPARELVKTAGLTVVDGAMGAIGGKINIGAEKISNKVIVDFCLYLFLQINIFLQGDRGLLFVFAKKYFFTR